ncbi:MULTISPECIES: cobaltochelatase subunit CobN [Acidiplasma]|uniref:Cobalamin biosynthesis protein CobN n=3 Tax=Acidiplasma TaxID=507753 RepID=A0A0Q0RI04_9ARCH|nr:MULTISPECIES: cobaltochelatase subunit CobN [Acidiplasma]KJE49228.1 cobalamin biosynthesis protein CobN [Acidiplasma sp. MBA-1]KPV46961.1 cobalamin biosynthesis protein CobN [Acidiplasma aeolicum]KQB34962.1 cobalamin biosynthesis protein CobN [Acidiplasma cupricumulans]WMT54806.1 MAG: cobaltochelatase subunit CobN [Acidiplasma sp.]
MKFAVLIGWNGSVVKSFLRAGEETGNDVRIKYPRLDPIDDDFLNFVRDADALFIHHFSGENIYSSILEKLEKIIGNKKYVIAIDPILSKYSNVDPKIVEKVSLYYFYGGYNNIKNLVLYVQSFFEKNSYNDPDPLPFSGIYRPKNLNLNKYNKRVGILFYRTAWVDGDTKIVDEIIKKLDERGISSIPVFTNGFGDSSKNIKSAEECINEYFYENGRVNVDAVINLLSFSLIKGEEKNTLLNLNVPVFQGLIYYYKEYKEWIDSSGLDVVSSIMSAMLPEIDGTIEPILVGVIKKISEKGTVYRELSPVYEQINYMANRIKKWVNLKYKNNGDKKIAIILHSGSSFKDLEANIGTATGLDTLNSVANIMKILKNSGFSLDYVPENGEDLIQEILRKKAIPEGKWTSIENIIDRKGAVDTINSDEYSKIFNSIPEDSRKAIINRWGNINWNRDYMVLNSQFYIPGLLSGNIFIGIQPKRITFSDDDNSIRTIHDSETPITHYWLAFYKWIETKFGADAIIHVGTHGTLEFTPGKGLGLSPSCFPEISIGTMPNIYLYSTNVPGEGIIAKRRSYAVLLDYITPPTSYDEVPDEINKLEELIDDYEESEKSENNAREDLILRDIKNLASKIGLSIDFDDAHKATHEIEHRINLFKDSVITHGLYVYAQEVNNDDLPDYVATATRFDEHSLISMHGKDAAVKMIKEYINHNNDIPELERGIINNLKFSSKNEENNLLKALNGEFIPSGLSGSLARGRYDVLPSGRNFYAVDPFKIPSQSAWQVGVILANKLIEAEYKKNNKFPETVGFVLWSTDAYRSDGELISQILFTIGVEPIWQEGSKKVSDVRVIPMEKLQRPRIDVVIESSGIVRDNLFNIIELIDTAIRKVAELDESEEDNYIKKHYREYGHLMRIFSSKPGSYGSGVSNAVESSKWKNENDLADVFIEWMGYSYGKNNFGREAKNELSLVSKNIDTIIHKREIDEIDINDDSCNYSYAGGFYLMAKKYGSSPNLMFEDTFNPSRPQVRTMKEEIERTAIGKLLNDKWINAQKNFGYRGATEMLKKIEHLYGWAATTKMVNDAIFNNIAEKFILNNEMKEWFKRENPWALSEITSRMIEAYKRGIWNASEDMREKLDNAYIEMEGESE